MRILIAELQSSLPALNVINDGASIFSFINLRPSILFYFSFGAHTLNFPPLPIFFLVAATFYRVRNFIFGNLHGNM